MRRWWQVPRVLAILPPAYHEVGQRQFSEVVGVFFVGLFFFSYYLRRKIDVGGWGVSSNREIVSFRLCVRVQLYVRSEWISNLIANPFSLFLLV